MSYLIIKCIIIIKIIVRFMPVKQVETKSSGLPLRSFTVAVVCLLVSDCCLTGVSQF